MREKELHNGVRRFFTPFPLTAPTRQGGLTLQLRREDSFMKRTAGFRAQQLVWRTLASALLFLAMGAYAPLSAAAGSTPLPEVGPAMRPQQGILIVYGG
jgi:hypothetical protein